MQDSFIRDKASSCVMDAGIKKKGPVLIVGGAMLIFVMNA
jgi:hypothetical protein